MYDFREAGETWLDALTRIAEDHGMEEDIEASFYACCRDGMAEDEAAHAALHQCDIEIEQPFVEEDTEDM